MSNYDPTQGLAYYEDRMLEPTMDIVARLRGAEPCKDLVALRQEAADEIERLREEVQNLRDNLSGEVEVAVAQIGNVNIEIEREECAKYAQAYSDLSSNEYGIVAGREIAKAIRARTDT